MSLERTCTLGLDSSAHHNYDVPMETNRTLVLVRHAHRDRLAGREIDDGLSEKGQKQVHLVLNHYRSRFGDESTCLASSPKLRCIETLMPLSNSLDVLIQKVDSLDEGGELRKKTQEFLHWWSAQPSRLTVACSHGDWIPAFLQFNCGAWVDLNKGGWIELEGVSKSLSIRWVLQQL